MSSILGRMLNCQVPLKNRATTCYKWWLFLLRSKNCWVSFDSPWSSCSPECLISLWMCKDPTVKSVHYCTKRSRTKRSPAGLNLNPGSVSYCWMNMPATWMLQFSFPGMTYLDNDSDFVCALCFVRTRNHMCDVYSI